MSKRADDLNRDAIPAPNRKSKCHASFADMLHTLRCESVRREVLSLGLRGRGSRKILKTLLHAVQQAA